jgi:hypothetical protein
MISMHFLLSQSVEHIRKSSETCATSGTEIAITASYVSNVMNKHKYLI